MSRKRPLRYGDIFRSTFESLRAQPLRSILTASSMGAAVAAVVLVATVAATGSAFVIAQIEGVGSNLVFAYYEAGGNVSAAEADYIDHSDVGAVQARLGSLASAVAGVTTSWDSVSVDGHPMQIRVLGASDQYRFVRNLEIHTGRFIDRADIESRSKVCLLTPQLSAKVFGPRGEAVGRSIAVHGLDFRIVGEFSERVETFGQTEVSENSVLVPYTVLRYFQEVERVDPLYVSVSSHERVEEAARLVRETLEARHRPGSLYRVDTLSSVLSTAKRILSAMSLAMVLVASITLGVSGVFIMNMMLIAVSERTAEIGLRKAVGATRREIRLQFLFEAATVAVIGGVGGAILGTSIPSIASRGWPDLAVRVPAVWVAFALLVSAGVGIVFGLLPASRASRLEPVEALRHD